MNNQQKKALVLLIGVVIISTLTGLMNYLANKFAQSDIVKLAVSIVALVLLVVGDISLLLFAKKHYDKDDDAESQNYNRKMRIIYIVVGVICALAMIIGIIYGLVS